MVAGLVGIPVLGYLLGPIRRRPAQAWILLGLERFPAGETRLATYENPFRVAWDGQTAQDRLLGPTTRGEQFQVFAINYAPPAPGALVRALTAVHVPLPWRGGHYETAHTPPDRRPWPVRV